MLEIHLNVVASDIRGHGDNWCTIKLSDQMTSRHPVQIRHDNIHQNHIILHTFLNFVHSFKTIQLEQSAYFRAKDHHNSRQNQ